MSAALYADPPVLRNRDFEATVLGPHILAWQDWLEPMEPNDYLWYCRPGGRGVRRSQVILEGSFDFWWRRCLKAAGVRYRKPHTTRHTFATRWLRRGGRLTTLSEQLGHSSIATTFDLYSHLDATDVRRDLALMEEVR